MKETTQNKTKQKTLSPMGQEQHSLDNNKWICYKLVIICQSKEKKKTNKKMLIIHKINMKKAFMILQASFWFFFFSGTAGDTMHDGISATCESPHGFTTFYDALWEILSRLCVALNWITEVSCTKTKWRNPYIGLYIGVRYNCKG